MNIFNKNENQKIKINFEIIKNNNNTNNNNNNNNNINFFQEKTNERKLTDIILYDSLIKILSDCIKNNNNNNNDFNSLYIYNEKEKIPTEIFFKKFYFEKILRNPNLYCIDKATSYFYLISIFHLATKEYKDIFNLKNKIFPNEIFENKKINSLLLKQTSDSYAISTKSIPNWCYNLSINFPFLSDFDSRFMFFKTCTFDNQRNITNLLYLNNKYKSEKNLFEKINSRNKRRKIKIDRKKIMQSVQKIIDLNKDFKVN
jgi:hypothetical protein